MNETRPKSSGPRPRATKINPHPSTKQAGSPISLAHLPLPRLMVEQNEHSIINKNQTSRKSSFDKSVKPSEQHTVRARKDRAGVVFPLFCMWSIRVGGLLKKEVYLVNLSVD